MDLLDFAISFAITLAVPLLWFAMLGLKRRISRGLNLPFKTLFLSILCILGILLIAVSLLVGVAFLIGPLVVFWWLVVIYVFIKGVRKYKATQQYALLWMLAVSAERSMPLAPAIEAFARERRGSFGRRARRLAEMLNTGASLPDALERCRGLLPEYALPMVRVGCDSGALSPALRQATAEHNLHEPIWVALFGKIAYLLMVPAFGFLVLTFLMLKIIPSFQKIFADFGTPLPWLTQLLISVADFFINAWYLFAPFYLLGMLLLLYGVMRYFGWIYWDLPGMARLTRRLDSARILDALALVARQRQPLPEGIAALAQSYPKNDIRRRLRQSAADIQAGRDWCESLLERGLIRQPELAILQSAQRVGNLPWALHEMADSSRRRLVYRVQATAQVLFPPIVVFMGLVVMFIVVALFLPLISLIQHMV